MSIFRANFAKFLQRITHREGRESREPTLYNLLRDKR